MRFITLFLALAFAFYASAEERRNPLNSKVQVYLTFRELTIPSKTLENIGFDWLSANNLKNESKTIASSESFDSRKALFTRLRRPLPLSSDKALGDALIVLTPSQIEVVYKELEKEEAAEFIWFPSTMLYQEEPGLVTNGDREIAMIAAASSDNKTIDLEVFLAGYKARQPSGEADPDPDTVINIRDGQTVAINVKSDSGVQKVVFAMAQLCDTDGIPIGKARPATDQNSE